MTRTIGAIALLILAGCTTTGIDNNPKTREDAMASAKRVSGDPTTVFTECALIGYDSDDNGTNDTFAFVIGQDWDGDTYTVEPASTTDITADGEYGCVFDLLDGYVLVTDSSGVGTDCDDADDTVSGSSTAYYVDADGDHYGAGTATMVCGAAPSGSVANNADCDDGDIDTSPDEGANEESDGCYRDSDQDGYGDDNPPEGVDAGTDCDDVQTAHIEINPGMAEVCNGVNDNCDSGTDEVYYPDSTSSEAAASEGAVEHYSDEDGDYAYGTFAGYACEDSLMASSLSIVPESTDCDDHDDTVYPGATDVCDGIDQDCDDDIDEDAVLLSYYTDADADGYGTGAATSSCSAPSGKVANSGDCNDANGAINPLASEICDSADNDCDGSMDEGVTNTFYADSDGDTYGDPSVTQSTCEASAGYVSNSGDCNDTQALAYSGAAEVCDGVDNDCDAATDEGVMTTYYADADSDHYGVTASTTTACSEPSGYAAVGADCNDAAASINPGATESCNSLDDNCDGNLDEGLATSVSYHDADGDGYGDIDHPSSAYCAVPSGYAGNSTDCNDGNEDVNPGATQVANNGLDDNCDGTEPAEEVCTVPTFSSTSVYYQLWLDNLDVSTDDSNWNYPGLARGRADAEICAQNVAITEGDSWKANGTFSTTATSGTFYASSWSFAAYGNGDGYENFDYITVMGVEVDVTKTSWGGGADGLFEIDFTLPVE